ARQRLIVVSKTSQKTGAQRPPGWRRKASLTLSNIAPQVHFAGAPAAMRKNALAEAATDANAQTIAAAWNPPMSAGPAAPRTPPSTAVATIPPVRAIALFRPDAEPVCRLSTDPKTARSTGLLRQPCQSQSP